MVLENFSFVAQFMTVLMTLWIGLYLFWPTIRAMLVAMSQSKTCDKIFKTCEGEIGKVIGGMIGGAMGGAIVPLLSTVIEILQAKNGVIIKRDTLVEINSALTFMFMGWLGGAVFGHIFDLTGAAKRTMAKQWLIGTMIGTAIGMAFGVVTGLLDDNINIVTTVMWMVFWGGLYGILGGAQATQSK